jgi:TolB-like protein
VSNPDPNRLANDPKSADGVSLLSQLKERRVFRSAIAYAVVAWGVTEILNGVVEGLGWPDWLATLAVILFVTGFPVAMFLAWVFDWTPDGIRRTAPAGAMGWLQILAAASFLVGGSAGLFWLINPGGIAHIETVGLAVMPCRYRGSPESAYRGDGIAEVLNARFAYSDHLFVPDFTSIRELSAQNLNTSMLGSRLNVGWLIECRISEGENRLSIDTTLVKVSTDESSALTSANVASLSIAQTLRNLEIAAFNRLGIPHEGDTATPISANLTPSLEAFDVYLMGLHEMRDGTPEALSEARRHFRHARTIDDFSLARLGEAEAMMALMESETPGMTSARATTLGAIALILEGLEGGEPTAELYAARLRYSNLSDRLDFRPMATAENRKLWFERATTLRPSFAAPYFHYAAYLERLGRSDEAEAYLARARQIAPGSDS